MEGPCKLAKLYNMSTLFGPSLPGQPAYPLHWVCLLGEAAGWDSKCPKRCNKTSICCPSALHRPRYNVQVALPRTWWYIKVCSTFDCTAIPPSICVNGISFPEVTIIKELSFKVIDWLSCCLCWKYSVQPVLACSLFAALASYKASEKNTYPLLFLISVIPGQLFI